jgi:hypothetical protein
MPQRTIEKVFLSCFFAFSSSFRMMQARIMVIIMFSPGPAKPGKP